MLNKKREILEKIAKEESSGHSRRRGLKILNCGHNSCPFALPVNIFDYRKSTAIQTSPEFAHTLADIKENYPADHLCGGSKILSDFFEQEGIPGGYEHFEIDPLEDSGIHITANPGFSYS